MRMTRFIGTVTVLLVVISGFSSVYAGDVENGKMLYEKNCLGCHDTRIHTRPNRIIHTYGDLANRVKFCDAQVKAGFSDDQLKSVTDYLNTEFYKFVKD
ncbi:MAG: cytochrome c [Gammaproteobacteria bacterium]|jgi:cytochrome c2|nr:cytochrome c [Gammaproteobacteria bacterium]